MIRPTEESKNARKLIYKNLTSHELRKNLTPTELFNVASKFKFSGRTVEAISLIEKAMTFDVTIKIEGTIQLIQLYKKAELYNESLELIEQSLKQYPEHTDQRTLNRQKRIVLKSLGRPLEALTIQTYCEALEIEEHKREISLIIKSSDSMAFYTKGRAINTGTTYGITPAGNPITNHRYKVLNKKLKELISSTRLSKNLSKAIEYATTTSERAINQAEYIRHIVDYFTTQKTYTISDIKDILRKSTFTGPIH